MTLLGLLTCCNSDLVQHDTLNSVMQVYAYLGGGNITIESMYGEHLEVARSMTRKTDYHTRVSFYSERFTVTDPTTNNKC